ncbi:5-carboxymethyl-2-hydroxymuconate Delta-isomerase [Shewanella avicenniae]|uniref:5-carboxymethyl-2-hydroxymuconate Delta-isomerase n=1 Tax=Shewanella avicenniae TaxID=2814294 RepID=A0ABX7QVV9_9GAMM|nr:5-carboxymethyl-2-hydroxymuconate Delta-isomerase [Shewanella avicenniae]QSX35081.1 5-carboxymethyl-2-hydroxymuconate Delta-isomerase [Shewanella avicenniae]
MPHVIIEYSANVADELDIAELVQTAHKAAIATGLFNPDAVKSRAHQCHHFTLGTGKIDSFIHINVRMLPGRTLEQQQLLTQTLFDAVNAFAPAVGGLSVETTDLASESYRKK